MSRRGGGAAGAGLAAVLARAGPALAAAAAEPGSALGDGPAELARAAVEAGGRVPVLAGRTIGVSGTVELGAQVCSAGEPPELFGVRALPPVPEGSRAVHLRAASGAALGPVRRLPVRGPWLLVGGRAAASMTYERVLVLPEATRRRDALAALLDGAEVPWELDPSALGAGEVHRFATAMSLSLGVDFELSWQAVAPGLEAVLAELGDGVVAAFEAGLTAGFGLALDEEMDFTVGRALVTATGRVRVRVSRSRTRELSWGARLSLQAAFAAGTPLAALLDRALERPGWRELAAVLAAAGETGRIAAAVAAGEWDEVAGRTGAAAADALLALAAAVGGEDGSLLAGVLEELRRVAVSWAELSGEVQGFWEALMDEASLADGSPAAVALDRLAAALGGLRTDGVDGVIEALAGGGARRWEGVIALLETLSGWSLDALLTGGDGAAEALARAEARVREAVAFREAVASLPEGAAQALWGALESMGIAGVAGALASLADPEALRSLAAGSAAAVAERLIGRAVAEAGEAELDRVRSWAARVRDLLEDADVAGGLRALLDRLNGRAGVSLALEVDRLTRTGALLDVELDPGCALAGMVLSDLARGDVRGALDRLFAGSGEADGEGFLLHDCVFTSRRTSLASGNLLLSLLGWEEDRTRAVTETWLRVRRQPEPERRARTSGGVVRFVKDPDRHSAEGTVWLTVRASGEGGDVAQPYDPASLDAELRLSYTGIDPVAAEGSIAALASFLASWGFAPPPEGPLETLIVPGESVRTGVSIRLGGAAVRGLLAGLDEAGWDGDVVEAARRWFSEGLVPLRLAHRRGIRLGDALAALVSSPELRPRPGEALHSLEARLAGRRLAVPVRDVAGRRRVLREVVVPRRTGGSCLPAPPFTPAVTVLGEPRRARAAMAAMGPVIGPLLDGGAVVDGASMAAAVKAFVTAFRRASNHHWPSPTLLLWLVRTHLERVAPDALREARGVATVRWRGAAESGWRGEATLTLAGGVPAVPGGAAPGRMTRAILER